MRIISGSARGTKLYTLEGMATRPTLDRVKEALFSILQNQMRDADVLDLFAGSGALGLEALSRGAKKAWLCDASAKAIAIIEKNSIKTHAMDRVCIVKKDFQKCLKQFHDQKLQFDIIFLDPPYDTDYIYEAVKQIMQYGLLKKNGSIIAETDQEERVLQQLQSTHILIKDVRKFGRVKLLFLEIEDRVP